MEREKDSFCIQIEEAIAKGELRPYFQPQYNAITNRMASAEALVRWVKSDGTMVMPGDFIPKLEESDAILKVDWHMLDRVCDFLARQEQEHINRVPIAVNFSRRHLTEQGFLEKLVAIVDSYGVSHDLIVVEITESAFVGMSEEIGIWIQEIREKGFRVAIDDFGSGLASLSFVKDVSVDILKIDKSLLSHNCEDEKERIVLESIFNFAHRLNLITVAEGVETREQLGFLRTCDSKVIQGFLYARPMKEESFLERCQKEEENAVQSEDILKVQAPSSAVQLLLDAVFMQYPLVILCNLTRNSFYMMTGENWSSTSCPSCGVFEELIEHGASTMVGEDQKRFADTFSIRNQMEAYERGDKQVQLITEQVGDDGIVRKVKTTNYFVKNPSVRDVLVITLCYNMEE